MKKVFEPKKMKKESIIGGSSCSCPCPASKPVLRVGGAAAAAAVVH